MLIKMIEFLPAPHKGCVSSLLLPPSFSLLFISKSSRLILLCLSSSASSPVSLLLSPLSTPKSLFLSFFLSFFLFLRSYHHLHLSSSLLLLLYLSTYLSFSLFFSPSLSSFSSSSSLSSFSSLLFSEEKDGKSLRLPLQWLWDILDEFVYQFQEACRWRQRIARRLPEDEVERTAFVKEMDRDSDVWKASQVLEFLHALVHRSQIEDFLKQQQSSSSSSLGGNSSSSNSKDDSTRSKMFETEIRYQLGYFAMILLLRLHVLMGDYFIGVKSIENIELSPRSFYWKVPAAHVTLFYHLGFAYMMMRRYNDAIRVMSQLLIFVSRQRSYLSMHFYQQASMNKTVDRMYILVMLCSSLCNVKLDESVNQMIKEKYSDKFYKLQQENDETYCDLFTWSCPKFVNPATPSFEDPVALERFSNSQSEVQLRQCKMFFREVEFHKKISTVSSFAKLYNNIQLSKLGSLMEVKEGDPEDVVRSDILSVKLKSRQKIWRSGSLLSGELISLTPDNSVEFYVEQDMLHVRSQQSQKVYMDHFLKQIERTQNLLQSIQGSSSSSSSSSSSAANPSGGGGGGRHKGEVSSPNHSNGSSSSSRDSRLHVTSADGRSRTSPSPSSQQQGSGGGYYSPNGGGGEGATAGQRAQVASFA